MATVVDKRALHDATTTELLRYRVKRVKTRTTARMFSSDRPVGSTE